MGDHPNSVRRMHPMARIAMYLSIGCRRRGYGRSAGGHPGRQIRRPEPAATSWRARDIGADGGQLKGHQTTQDRLGRATGEVGFTELGVATAQPHGIPGKDPMRPAGQSRDLALERSAPPGSRRTPSGYRPRSTAGVGSSSAVWSAPVWTGTAGLAVRAPPCTASSANSSASGTRGAGRASANRSSTTVMPT